MNDRERMNKLYKDRAEFVEMESEVADAKKYMRVGGFWWTLFSWFERLAIAGRKSVQRDIEKGGE